MIEFDPDQFSGSVPVFPLGNMVLFPHLILPLHIFEHRYREMTRDVLSGENLIAMALYKPGRESGEGPGLPFYETVTLGQVMQHESLPEGKFNLTLLGVSRARVLSAHLDKPYWQAELELVSEDLDGMDIGQNKVHYENLWKHFGSMLADPAKALPLPILCDLIASTFISDIHEKQKLLEMIDISKRCETLLSMAPPPPRRRWPKFSNN